MALPKKYRLQSEKDFSLLKEKGKLYSHPLMAMLLRQEKKASLLQFGFLISKKIDSRAVYRNRLKRRLAAAISFFIPQIKWSGQIVFLPRAKLKEKSTAEIRKIIGFLLAKAKIVEPKEKQ